MGIFVPSLDGPTTDWTEEMRRVPLDETLLNVCELGLDPRQTTDFCVVFSEASPGIIKKNVNR